MKTYAKVVLAAFLFLILVWLYGYYGYADSLQDTQKIDEHKIAKESYGWIWNDPDKALKIAAQENKRVLVYAWSRTCQFCAAMDKGVFSNETIKQTLFKYYVPVVIDIDSSKLANRYGTITGTPTFFFLYSNGTLIGNGKLVGYRSPTSFQSLLEKFAG